MFSARAVCSSVTSGFFPPRTVGLFGHEQQHQLAKDHVPQQASIAAALEVTEADLALGHAEYMFDPSPREGDFHQRGQSRLRRSVGDEVFDLSGLDVAGDDEPLGAGHRPAIAGEINLLGLDLPDLGTKGLALQADLPPLLADKGLAPNHDVVHAFGLEGPLQRGMERERSWDAAGTSLILQNFTIAEFHRRVPM